MSDSGDSELDPLQVLEKLESLEDEQLAVELLKEFNDVSGRHGKLILNLDPSLDHEEWKNLCDQAQRELDEVVAKIMSL